MSLWVVFILGGLATYGMRLSFIYLLGRVQVPERMRGALRFVAPAVLSAIVAPELIMPGGVTDISLHNYRLIAGMMAVLVAWRARNTFVTIAAGMALLILLQFAL
jgi:branched-subunit amino acid transport protein